MEARVAGLYAYPLKSARGVELKEAKLGSKGLPWDRHWMLIDEKKQHFVSQRKIPGMALLSTALLHDRLEVGFPDFQNLSVPFESPEANPFGATMHQEGEDIQVIDEGGEAANWFSEIFKDHLRLVRIAPGFNRRVPDSLKEDNDFVELSDGYPYLVTSNASLDLFNSRFCEQGESDSVIEMERFRSNIVIDIAEPWAEMAAGLSLQNENGSIKFSLLKPCKRCGIPQVNPSTGKLDIGAALHRVLTGLNSDHELGPDNVFGQNAILKSGWEELLQVGQRLELRGA